MSKQGAGIETWYYYSYETINNQRMARTYWVTFQNGIAISERAFRGREHLK